MASRKKRDATAVARLRTAGWILVALAVYQSGINPGPGGAQLGLMLAGLLATYLRATRVAKHGAAHRIPKGRRHAARKPRSVRG